MHLPSLRNRQPKKALQILKGFQSSVRRPGDYMYYGLALAANGKVDVAKPYLQTALGSNHLSRKKRRWLARRWCHEVTVLSPSGCQPGLV